MELFSGNLNKVIVTREEVVEFMHSYPCSGLCSGGIRHYWFEFDTHGDLVDTDVPEHEDGFGALALANEAMVFWENTHRD